MASSRAKKTRTVAKKQPQGKSRAEAPLNIFLVGDLGAGKATQSGLIKRDRGLYEFDFGLEQARLRRADKTLDNLLKKTVDIGKLTPTKVYRLVTGSAIARVKPAQGILFDGGPRMPGEVRMVARLLKQQGRSRSICIYLTVTKREAIKRITNRPGYFGKGKRIDDSLEAVRNRFKYVQTSVHRAREVYKSLYPFAQVSGMGSVAEVRTRVVNAIARLEKQV